MVVFSFSQLSCIILLSLATRIPLILAFLLKWEQKYSSSDIIKPSKNIIEEEFVIDIDFETVS
jgi:hypothetical protein